MLMDIIEFKGKKFITSKKFHEEVKPTSGVSETNRAIREMPSYEKLVKEEHLVEVDSNYVKSLGNAELASLIKSNSYKPVMLIDPVAQKEIEHHFKVSVNQAIQSSKENAVLGLFGIDLEALTSSPEDLAMVRLLSEHAKLKAEQQRIKEEQLEQRLQLLELKRNQDNLMLTQGDAQFFSILAYASIKKVRISVSEAKAIGKMASRLCKEEGIQTGEVPDQRYGRVKTYPKEVLEQSFEDYFSEDE